MLVSLSVGVARIGDRDRRLDHAMAAAELACRTAKERGRNRVEVFYGNEQKSVNSPATGSFATQVSAALAADAFELLAQPILPLSSAPADPRFEILLRMRAADGTRLGLEKLCDAAACQDLTRSVDRWIAEQAIQRLAASRHLLQQHPAKFSINLSAASLADAEFWRMLEATRAPEPHRARNSGLRISRGSGERPSWHRRAFHVPPPRAGNHLCA
jgi:predicted signal transduction protein with EAL and GGDEF domain